MTEFRDIRLLLYKVCKAEEEILDGRNKGAAAASFKSKVSFDVSTTMLF